MIRIALAQINARVGDIEGNLNKILSYIGSAKDHGVDIVCFPELAITGYPPEDLLLKPNFISRSMGTLERIRKASGYITVITGFPDRKEDIYNAAAIIHDKEIVDIYHKRYLPNYGVFDENRYFQSGLRAPVYKLDNLVFGVNICEDIWYPGDPTRKQALLGDAQVIINISSSPYHASKVASRERMLRTRARDNSVNIAFCNMVGSQDELVFDGHSVIISESGDIIARAKSFEEDMLIADINVNKVFRTRIHDPRRRQERHALEAHSQKAEVLIIDVTKGKNTHKPPVEPRIEPFNNEKEEILKALVLGTRDYVTKNGFKKVAVGLSGGIDSALVAAVAVEALGGKNVVGVAMPSMYSSEGSISDSEQLSENLGIELHNIPIESTFNSYIDMMSGVFKGTKPDITEENLQARIRGNILMALSNKFGWLILTTGNKSEMSVGYCTLYGDMAGGFAVIKDVPKTVVYEIAKHYNESKGKSIIPDTILTKPPSAELSPDQLDTDSLPPYEVLDPILKAYVEDDMSADEIVAQGFKKSLVQRIIRLVDLNEYKRRQAPPGIKITPRAFGKDRRFPITNLYKA